MQALLEERELWEYVHGEKEKPQVNAGSTAEMILCMLVSRKESIGSAGLNSALMKIKDLTGYSLQS